MPARQVEGAALLVAGHGAPGVGALDASAVHTLGQIGEALLATGAPWHIRRLTATGGDRYAADRKTIKRSLADLINDPVRVAVLVLLGEIVELSGELCLVTGADAHEYPEDATLPLSWIRERLANTRAEHLVVAISARGDGDPVRWLGALGTEGRRHLVAIDSPHDGNPMVDSLLAGLCGEALDPQTGTVTMASLSKHLLRHSKCVQTSNAEDTVAQPPPLAGLWDVRHSQLANRPRPRHAPGEPEDLAGTVLPGRFRIDQLVARGTFGTVYRARQLAVERDVAIKVLHADIDPSSEDGRLFVNEIRNVGRIDHANVVRIHQADITHDGRLFFAMELLDGKDLQQLGTSKLEKGRAVDLVRQLLVGLGAAHDAGIVHADIKPANAIVIPPRINGEHLEASELRSTTHERAVLVDFGLARLRPASGAAQSAGGTPLFMAPEQMLAGRVDTRSDLFSVGLVLLWLVSGWRRPNAVTMHPSAQELEKLIDDEHLRQVIARALDSDPAKRFQKAREFSAALAGAPTKDLAKDIAKISQETPILPFRSFAPLTENDRGRLHGRDSDVTIITEHALYRRCVIYAAPSGTGKTSTLRAGLLPRLEALGIHAVYVPCRTDFAWSVVKAIAPGAPTIADAITQFHEHRGGKLVIVVDQLETALSDPDFIAQLLAYDRWPRYADVSIVLAVREDYLARLLARTQPIEPNLPIVRLPPLSLAGARAAIVTPLTEGRLQIERELLDVLLHDLRRAAEAIGPEMGWGSDPAVFPPHLQLVCSVLHESMQPNEETMTLLHYRRLGGFDAIVGEHLQRVIETELDDGRDLIARDLFLALVTASHQRAVRPESELFSIVGAKHGGSERVKDVLEVLRDRGLVLRVRGDTEPSWELVHDSLVERVLAWIDTKDLARRRAIEVVRYHLRRSTKDTPSLLARKELRELRVHEGAVEELDKEWSKRGAPDVGWTPSQLVARSRLVARRSRIFYASVVIAALLVGGGGLYRSREEAAKSREQASLRDRDLGSFTLRIAAFDWYSGESGHVLVPHEVDGWMLHSPDLRDPRQPGEPFAEHLLLRGKRRENGMELVEDVEAHGGAAFLVVARRGCSPSIVPIARLPGYANRGQSHEISIRVPSCKATRAGMVTIPAGWFVFGGVGQPAAEIYVKYPEYAVEQRVNEPAFAIDRTEVPNSHFKVFASMASVTGIEMPKYPVNVNSGDPSHLWVPVTGVDWKEASAFCRFLGKELPSTRQWTKALRGGEEIGSTPNPSPRRNLPWIDREIDWVASGKVAQVGTRPEDSSPYGVLDLAGNVTEWTQSLDKDGSRIIRGGNWDETRNLTSLVNFIAIDNPREDSHRRYSIGVRCAMAIDNR